ncbi:MAG: DUF4080 domain-containing protein [Fuerstiella sp.]
MPDIVLTTLNARYWHSSFGLRYLMANMGELTSATTILEFGINDRQVDIIAAILSQNPRIVGIGVYIWNVEPATSLVTDLKRLRPDLTIVVGGPEVSYDHDGQAIVDAADFVITGEADLAFPELCRQLLNSPDPGTGVFSHNSGQIVPLISGTFGFREDVVLPPQNNPSAEGTRSDERVSPAASPSKVIHGGAPALDHIALPYHLYTEEDIAHRVIYVEASRGCPFTCEFCLSALEIPVRQFDLRLFLDGMQALLDRGARQFKFVDRTFNLNLRISSAILQFFLDRFEPGMFLHFEMIPDRLPDSLRQQIAEFPDGALQFEIGVQTFNDDVGELISRRQDNDRLAENFRFLREQTGVHLHADLIVGLPGESLESFAAGVDRLVGLDPQEIQVGLLKRLKGTPITRHDESWQMVYSSQPPFEILSNRLIPFATMHRLRRFSRYWDLVSNSGNFLESTKLIWRQSSPFAAFLEFSDWIYSVEQRTHGIPLGVLVQRVFEFLTTQRGLSGQDVGPALLRDYARSGRRDVPAFLRAYHDAGVVANREVGGSSPRLPRRQARHVPPSNRAESAD